MLRDNIYSATDISKTSSYCRKYVGMIKQIYSFEVAKMFNGSTESSFLVNLKHIVLQNTFELHLSLWKRLFWIITANSFKISGKPKHRN